MRRVIEIIIVAGLILTQFVFSTDLTKIINTKEEKKIEASGAPVAQEVEVGNSIDVSNSEEFVVAYTNPEIRNINFMANIVLTEEDNILVYNHMLVRNLKINGNGFMLTTVNNTFNLGVASNVTFHLANLVIDKQSQDGIGDFISFGVGGKNIILENISSSATSLRYDDIVYGNSNFVKIFIRGQVGNIPYDNNFSTNAEVIFEVASKFEILNTGTVNGVFVGGNSYMSVYILENSNVHVSTKSTYHFFHKFSNVLTSENSQVLLESSSNPNGIIGNFDGEGREYGLFISVSSGASFKVHNSDGYAIYAPGAEDFEHFRLSTNPGSVVELIGSVKNSSHGAVHINAPNSNLFIGTPKYFDIRNNQPGHSAISMIENSDSTRHLGIQIVSTQIGLWEKGSQNLNINPTAPSPFFYGDPEKAGKFYLNGSNGLVQGVNSLDNYSRIATSINPMISAENLTMAISDEPKAIVKNLIEPAEVVWNYTGYDNSVISVDSNGIVTPLKAGTTTVNVLAIGTNNYTSIKKVTVIITGPVMTVNPLTVSLPLNSSTPDYYLGVNAIDSKGTQLEVTKTGSVNTLVNGIYPITYSATDAWNNTVTQKRDYVIGNNVSVGNYAIFANSFTKRISEVDTSDAAIMNAADVKVFDLTTGLQIPNNTLTYIINKDRYTNVVDEYPITFSTTVGDTTLSIGVVGTVAKGNIPTFNGVETISVPLNSTFNPMAGVSGSDTEDGIVTDKMTYTGTVNTNVAGIYLLTYSLIDSDGNNITKTRSVVVNDGSYVIDGIYAISAHDFKVREDLFDASDEALIKEANVKVFNLTDGSEIANPKITVNSTGFDKKVGEYSITFSFNPKITVRANVVANLSPELTVPFMEVKQGATINPMDGVVAIDAEDGDLINEVIYGALPDTNKLGVHKLQYAVTDTFGNTTTKTRVILVNDGTYTVGGSYIFKAHDFSINQSSLIDTNEELAKLSGLEIYSTTSGEKVTTGYNVNDGGYSRAPGKYTITFTIGDGSVSVVGNVIEDGIKLPKTGSENGLIYLLLISTLAFRLFKRRA